MNYKKILLAIDDSDVAVLALEEALYLVKNNKDAVLRIVHVAEEVFIDWASGFVNYLDLQEAIKERGLAVLKQVKEEVVKAGVECEDKLIEIKSPNARISEAIIAEAAAWPADLIVIGTHGRKGFNHFLLGSVAEGVLRSARIPVLLVPAKKEHRAL